MWMWRERLNNPHYQRLILITEHQPRSLFQRRLSGLFLFLVLSGIWALMSLNHEIFYYLILFVLFLFTMLMSAIASWFVANDCGGVEYELVRLTILSSRKLAAGYWHGFYQRLKWQMRLPTFSFAFILLIMNMYLLYFKYRAQPAIVNDYYWQETMLNTFIGWLVTLTVLGGFWIYPMLGISIGLSLHRPMLASIVTLMVIPVLVAFWVYAVFIVVVVAFLASLMLMSIFATPDLIVQLILFSGTFSVLAGLLLLTLFIMGEMTHGFAKENI